MKILQVIDTLNIGGAERIVVMLSNLLHDNGIEVGIVLLVEDGLLANELNPNIPIYRLERERRFDDNKMKIFSEIIKDYDIIHCHLKHNFRYTQIVKLRYNISSKIIFQDHSHIQGVSRISFKYLKDSLFKNILKPKYYIGVSKSNLSWARKYLKVHKDYIFLLENTIVKENIINSGIKDDKIILVSNITPIKKIEFAIELIKEIKEDLVIYGRVSDEVYYKSLQKLIKDNGLDKNVTFISNCSNIQQEIPKYKLAIHTSIKETGPLVLIEYLAQSLPFLSTSTGQVYNQINKDIPQFFINNYNIEEWKRKLKHLNEVSKNKIEAIYKRNFSSVNYIQKCIKIYQTILNS